MQINILQVALNLYVSQVYPPPGKDQWPRQIANESQITPKRKKNPTISNLSFLDL